MTTDFSVYNKTRIHTLQYKYPQLGEIFHMLHKKYSRRRNIAGARVQKINALLRSVYSNSKRLKRENQDAAK